MGRRPMQMVNRHIKRCSISLVIRDMQIKTTVRYHLTLVRMAIIRNPQTRHARRECGEKGTFLTPGGNVNRYSGEQYRSSLEK